MRSEGEEDDGRGNQKKVKRLQSFNAGILESLPVELHHLLFDWLPFATLVHLNEVCTFWKAVLDDETLWRRRYTLLFGPLSRCHLTLPLPPHLSDAAPATPKKALKWKKRFFIMKNLSQCHHDSIKAWPLLQGSPHLTRRMMGDWFNDNDLQLVLSALLVDDIKLFEETLLRCTNLSYSRMVSKQKKNKKKQKKKKKKNKKKKKKKKKKTQQNTILVFIDHPTSGLPQLVIYGG